VTRSLETKDFARFARREGLPDSALGRAVAEMERGLVDADLGGGVVEQRLARRGQGTSGGYRAIVVFRRLGRVVFVFGYAKRSRSTVDPRELAGFRLLANHVLAMSTRDVDRAV
jgi:hypothetical protein